MSLRHHSRPFRGAQHHSLPTRHLARLNNTTYTYVSLVFHVCQVYTLNFTSENGWDCKKKPINITTTTTITNHHHPPHTRPIGLKWELLYISWDVWTCVWTQVSERIDIILLLINCVCEIYLITKFPKHIINTRGELQTAVIGSNDREYRNVINWGCDLTTPPGGANPAVSAYHIPVFSVIWAHDVRRTTVYNSPWVLMTCFGNFVVKWISQTQRQNDIDTLRKLRSDPCSDIPNVLC